MPVFNYKCKCKKTKNLTPQNISYKNLSSTDFEALIILANEVHGAGYLDLIQLESWYQKGLTPDNENLNNSYNASYVAYHKDKLIGFRITYAVGNWQLDQWLTPTLWQVDQDKVCYFKCNTIDEKYRGLGIGKALLNLSIATAKKQGALAGVSHLWKQSPNNGAISYFTRCGGKLIKMHADKWYEESQNGYDCILCGLDCHCEAAEMIIYFS